MITPSLPRHLFFAAAVLAVHASAQTSPPPAFDPVIALEQAVQLADFQNDPASAKAFLEKLIGPEIPAKIREQAMDRLAKMNVSTNPVTETKNSSEGTNNQGQHLRTPPPSLR